MANTETKGDKMVINPADLGEVINQEIYDNGSVHLSISLRKGEYLVVSRVLNKQIISTMGKVVSFPELSPFSRTAEDDVLGSIASQDSVLKLNATDLERVKDMKKAIYILLPVMIFSLLLSGISYYILRISIIRIDNSVDPFMLIAFMLMGLVWFSTAATGLIRILKLI